MSLFPPIHKRTVGESWLLPQLGTGHNVAVSKDGWRVVAASLVGVVHDVAVSKDGWRDVAASVKRERAMT